MENIDIQKYTDLAVMYTSEYGLKIIAALIIFLVGKWVAKSLLHLSNK